MIPSPSPTHAATGSLVARELYGSGRFGGEGRDYAHQGAAYVC